MCVLFNLLPHFWNSKITGYCWTDGPMDQLTNEQTDRPSYRDARTHLKIDFIGKYPLNTYCHQEEVCTPS